MEYGITVPPRHASLHSRTTPRLHRLGRATRSGLPALLGLGLLSSGLIACGNEGSSAELGSVTAALTAEQCNFFQVDGKVQICHKNSSTRKPYTIVKISTEACVDGHAAHDGDYVAIDDPDCKGLGCFPAGAPFDGTVECCDYLWPDATGHCAPVVCPADTACTTWSPDRTGGTCTPTHLGAATSCEDGVVTTINDRCDGAGSCAGDLCEGASCVGTGELASASAGELLDLEGLSFTVPNGSSALSIHSTNDTPPTTARNGAFIVAYSPVYELGPTGSTFATPLDVRFAVAGRSDVTVFWSEDGVNYDEVDSTRVGDVLTVSTTHFSKPVVSGNPCKNKVAGDVCGVAPAGACAAAPTCQPQGGALQCKASFKASGTVCRSAAGACDVAETCTGTTAACPAADVLAPAGTVCRPAGGACDLAEACSGSAPACPADLKSTAACRPSAGVCDVAESCNGVGNDCPADGFDLGTTCDDAANDCEVAAVCGNAAACPAVTNQLAGTPCDDGNAATSSDACDGAGLCVGILANTCDTAGVPFGGGSGTAASPFLICTEAHLRATHNVVAYFEQTQDIAVSPITTANYAAAMRGIYDGAGHKVTNLNIVDGALNFVGLFGIIYNAAEVKNLVIENASISLTGGNYVGGLAGYLCGPTSFGGVGCSAGPTGKISNVTVSGAISGNASNLGGLVGNSFGLIEDCATNVFISGNGSTRGGLVGQNQNAHESSTGQAAIGKVFRSHATGNVYGLDVIGGAFGTNRGQAIDCSASGNVVGRNSIGGFAGFMRGSDQNQPGPLDPVTGYSLYEGYTQARTERSWATGKVDSYGQLVGGFAGSSERMFVKECWATGDVGLNSSLYGSTFYPQGRQGGFAGEVGGNLYSVAATRPGEIRDCWSRGAVKGQGIRNAGSAGREVGGFVGATNMSIRQVFTSVTLAPSVEITVGGNSVGMPFNPLGGGFFGGGYSNVNTDRNLNNNFSGCWWLKLNAAQEDAGLCTYPNYTVRCTVGAPASAGYSEGPSPENLYGIDAAEIPADGSTPANWTGLDFSATGAWTMASNTGSLAAYPGSVPVLKVQCGQAGVTCL